MRITNNMMIKNTSANINGNKVNVNALNLQMTSQKKIQRPSENPVIAIRSLRLRSTLSQIRQYNDKNIPDAKAWLEATETALYNMNVTLTKVKTQCIAGTNDYMTQEDRNAILKGLTGLKNQLYSEGNADNAGRTVFTGFRTGSQLTFEEDEESTKYKITQKISYQEMEKYDYFAGSVELPSSVTDVTNATKLAEISSNDFITKSSYNRVRLGYDNIVTEDTKVHLYNPAGGELGQYRVRCYASEEEWIEANGGKTVVGAGAVIVIQNTGDIILGDAISESIKSRKATIQIEYEKTGFSRGELRPEYYYNCTDITDTNQNNHIEYVKYDKTTGKKIYEDINYTVALNQTLTINIQADEVFDMGIYQDVTEMIDAVQNAINAHDKLDRLNEMKSDAKFAGCQAEFQKWIDAAKKEADYADSHLTTLFSTMNGKTDKYMAKLNVAYTEIGARGDQLEMTEARLGNLELAQDELKSTNEDKELSDVIIEYTAAFNAYQASLMAASKIEKQTLLDYI